MSLPWDKFAELEGDPTRNFELLCRGMVERNYGRFGQLRSHRQQPGVEFYMELDQDCELGSAGAIMGWQCRWYDLPKDKSLGVRRRRKIEAAIATAKAKENIPGLTDFVLCLRELPTKTDVDWYFALKVDVRLHLWADEAIESKLAGEAAILRQTYFGELVLTAGQLAESRERAIEPIKRRWLPDLHVATEVEDYVQQPLLRPGGSEDLRAEATRLSLFATALTDRRAYISDPGVAEQSDQLVSALETMSEHLVGIAEAADARQPADARDQILTFEPPAISVAAVRRLARALRSRRIPSAVAASAAEAELRAAIATVTELGRLVAAPLIAVLGDAGSGKTQLAAEFTAPSDASPAGIFIKGWDLRSGATLDDLAARVPSLGITSFDRLLEAVDAAGARNGVRLPIAIDGLNDSERPGEWQQQLAQLAPILPRYEHVVVLVTLRGAVQEVLPDGTEALELIWQDAEVEEATQRYFEHYRIEAGSVRLPLGLFRNPLFIRMFCEAVNPSAAESVGVEAIPASLVGVFELYRDRVDEKLRARPGQPALPPGHVKKKLAALANALWTHGTRELAFDDARQRLDGSEQDWDRSLTRALLEEGVLFRDDQEAPGDRVAILFDRLAGYLIADALLSQVTVNELENFLGSADLWMKLAGTREERHPLGDDVLVALVGLVPRRFFGMQVWKSAPAGPRKWALAQTLDLESRLLDDDTVDELVNLVQAWTRPQTSSRHPFDRLWEIRDGTSHKLNAEFLDRVLRSMPVADRDLTWSEWLRLNSAELTQDLDRVEARWAAENQRDALDELNARAFAWLLTTTNIGLRDRATRALARFGRVDPGRLFALASDFLDVNDLYVTERLLAASFGAATTHQMPDPGGPFERALAAWLEELRRRYLTSDATSPISHELAREYISGCFELAGRLHPAAVPSGVDVDALVFAAGPEPEPIPKDDERAKECDRTFGMDFENYTVGYLFEDRSNYEMDHEQFVAGLADIRGRVWQLGWRDVDFGEVDSRIRDLRSPERGPQKVERYGKKYGWIAYYELAGRLDDRDELRQREWLMGRGVWPDIDPTFPDAPAAVKLAIPAWASDGSDDDEDWYSNGEIVVPEELLELNTIDGYEGPWVAVEGSLEHRDAERQRRVWAFVRGLLVDPDAAATLISMLEEREYLGNDYIPRAPSDVTTFAGEIPWASRFKAGADMDNGQAPYDASVSERRSEDGVKVELLAHEYNLEAERTVTNVATGNWVASHRFAAEFQLRQWPGTLDLVTLDGRLASLTRRAPTGFRGTLLFLRQDLLAQYAQGRTLVQIVWGERQVDVDWANPPEWLQRARAGHSDLWRHLRMTST